MPIPIFSDAIDGEDCTWIQATECAAGRRRRAAFENVVFKRSAEGSGDVIVQENGIVASETLSAEITTTSNIVTEDGIEINKVRHVTDNLDIAMRRMAKNFKQARNRVRNLKKLIASTELETNETPDN